MKRKLIFLIATILSIIPELLINVFHIVSITFDILYTGCCNIADWINHYNYKLNE